MSAMNVLLMRQVSKHIIQDQSADVKAVRLILNVLNFLRNEQQDNLVKIRPRGKSGQSVSDAADPTLWSKVYHLKWQGYHKRLQTHALWQIPLQLGVCHGY